MAERNTIPLHRGQDSLLQFTMDPVPPGGIAGWTIAFTVAKGPDSYDKLFTVAATVTDGPLGKFDVVLPAATLDVRPGTYFHDATRTDTGNVRVLSYGPFILNPVARLPT